MGGLTLLDFDDLESAYWQDRPWRFLLGFMERAFPRLFHCTCVHTRELAEEVRGLTGLRASRILRLNQGVELGLFAPRGLEHSRRCVLLYAAHLGVAALGLNFVLEGFRVLARTRDDVLLLVAGGGSLLQHFHRKTRELGLAGRVVFAGHVSHARMAAVMNLARAAVNYAPPESRASRYRASVKVREYLATGLPVATNVVGSDLVAFLPFLEVFEANSTEGFALAVERALARGYHNEAKRALAADWAWEVVVARFLREFQTGGWR
jgi:glycosyltransferase involved in cell wall biosynthesis